MTREYPYQTLDWDSQTFGIPTATITKGDISPDDLRQTLQSLQKMGTKLVYFPSDYPLDNHDLLLSFEGILADEKVTFAKKLDAPFTETVDAHMHSYSLPFVSDELLELAFDSGLYSRFRVDPHFVNGEYQAIYRIWIEKSVSREIAHDVLVYEDHGSILGMVTVGEKNGRGDIGLVAVSGQARGKGIGKKLMVAAEADFRNRHYTEIQVVTQGINEAAVKLYTGSGFHIDKKVFLYHFWL